MSSTSGTIESAPRKRRRVRPAYLVLIAVLALVSYKWIQRTQQIRQLSAQQATLQYQNERIREDSARMHRLNQYYRTPNYVENEARAILGYTMPGEVAVQIQPVYQRAPVTRAAPQRANAPPSSWQQWWHSFFG